MTSQAMHEKMQGHRFGRLLVLGEASLNPRLSAGPRWVCLCSCGKKTVVWETALRRKKTPTKSCGCLARELSSKRNTTHGMKNTATYKSWDSMMQRCFNKNDKGYRRYGGRGISVCWRWLLKFEHFFADMGEKPHRKSLDRINNNKDYRPTNCRWATPKQQCRNRSSNTMLTVFNETKPIAEWAEDTRCKARLQTLYNRLASGWSDLDAITTPMRPDRRRTA